MVVLAVAAAVNHFFLFAHKSFLNVATPEARLVVEIVGFGVCVRVFIGN